MNTVERSKVVLAMETIARTINDEDVFEGWLLNGVADGDICEGEWDPSKVDEYYLSDDAFASLMRCFLRRMSCAYKSGGLYCDHVLGTCEK